MCSASALDGTAEQRHGPEKHHRGPFIATIHVFFMCWVVGEFFLLVDETIRQVAIHVFGVGK
jgi:hypothetical protein